MKIFFSHSSNLTDLVRRIIAELPSNVATWFDDDDLVWGDKLETTFSDAIREESDYVILVVSEDAGKSSWVHMEVGYALEIEKKLGRTVLLPLIITNHNGLSALNSFPELGNERKYIEMDESDPDSIRKVTNQIVSQLFHLACKELDAFHNPNLPGKLFKRADDTLEMYAGAVRSIVFSHREDNPISIIEVSNSLSDIFPEINSDEIEKIIRQIIMGSKIPGLFFDGTDMYLFEEHASWKSSFNITAKKLIASRAMKYVKPNKTLYIDSGSTTNEFAKKLAQGILSRSFSKLKIITPSPEILKIISDCCTAMGYDDITCPIVLYVPRGRVRFISQTIQQYSESGECEISEICDVIGKIDIAFVSANGISLEDGIKTYCNGEEYWKRDAMKNAKQTVILCDQSKWGILCEASVVDWEDDFTLITDISEENTELVSACKKYGDKIITV